MQRVQPLIQRKLMSPAVEIETSAGYAIRVASDHRSGVGLTRDDDIRDVTITIRRVNERDARA